MSSEKMRTPEFRTSFVKVFKPEKFSDDAPAKYSIVMLFDKKTDISELVAAAKKAREDKWGTDKDKYPKNLKNPIKDGDALGYEGFEGCVAISATSTDKPQVVTADLTERILDPCDFYSGCYAKATVRCAVFDHKGNKGVAFYLGNLQKVKDGDSLDGRAKPEDEFEPVASEKAEGYAKEDSDMFD
jgi:hypothetical protein